MTTTKNIAGYQMNVTRKPMMSDADFRAWRETRQLQQEDAARRGTWSRPEIRNALERGAISYRRYTVLDAIAAGAR